jgi:DNA-binding transcriptional MerR regulator
VPERLYASGEFARLAGVTVRTLRYYDRIGLLTPTDRSDAGYRRYSDDDLEDIEQILALKYLGFSLDEIRGLAEHDVASLEARLAKQKAMVRDKRKQLDDILHAIERAERALRAEDPDIHAIAQIIEVMRMEHKEEWVEKYFTGEQRATMDRLSEEAYSEEARAELASRGPWTETDQKRVDAQYAALAQELERLVAEGADPGSEAAQAAAETQIGLLRQFTQGDPEVEKGLQTWWAKFAELPADQKPPALPWGDAEATLLGEAMEIYRTRNA